MSLGRFLGNALIQAMLILLASALVLLAIQPPIPASLFWFYLAIIAVGLAVFVTATRERMESFWWPVRTLLVEDRLRLPRGIVLAAVPLALALTAGVALMPANTAPVSLRVIHPAPPATIQFGGKVINLREAQNPLRAKQNSDAEGFVHDVDNGKRVYYRNCFFCHGDHLAGNGHFAKALDPRPANFQDIGTIAQLQESYLFWRIAKGGPGLPGESWPGRSAMPRWEGILTEEEIWAVILFLYDKTGHPPRTWD